MSTTMQTPGVGTARPEQRHLTAALWVIVGLLAAALLALGAWVIVDRYTGPEYDATTLVDDLTAAWSAGDAGAVTALYTTDAVIVEPWARELAVGSEEIAATVVSASRFGIEFERVAPVTTEDDFATTFIRYTDNAGEEGMLISTFQLDEGKVARHWDFEIGVTPPFGPRTVIP